MSAQGLGTGTVLAVTLAYAALLFAIAFGADRAAARGRRGWLDSPLTYTLSLSVYCTSWTFFGAVGTAARGGMEFAAIYLGPTLVFLGFHTVLRRLLRIRHASGTTSIADLISLRYGRSDAVGALVTLGMLVATAPYIALQLKAIATSVEVIGSATAAADLSGEAAAPGAVRRTALWTAAGLALFAILFGTRSLDADERHPGVVAAIAVEAAVKLGALIAVGGFALVAATGGPADVAARLAETLPEGEDPFGARWAGLILLSGAAILCLPRQFQVTVVENADERHLGTAAWAFPLYLLLMSLAILPIFAVGATLLPPGSNPDMYVLTMPIALGREDLALLAFIGGFSSATSMVIVSSIALSTMISNHIVTPLAIRSGVVQVSAGGDMRRFLLRSRRLAVLGILGLGALYLMLAPEGAGLASIGLTAFAGVAQVLPALIAALYWPRANRRGALWGLGAGLGVWAWTLLLPGLVGDTLAWQRLAEHGPWGIAALRPGALMGMEGVDPLVHASFWSLALNVALLVAGSLSRPAREPERVQAARFLDPFRGRAAQGEPGTASADRLFDLTSRVLGPNAAFRLFRTYAEGQGAQTDFPRPDGPFLAHLERRLAASVGAASARAMVSRVAGGEAPDLDALVSIADETQALMEERARIRAEVATLEAANRELQALDARKDAFLSQVSHELRTPMTSIRSFAEILSEGDGVPPERARRFLGIVHDESVRLTRLLDEILDMSALGAGEGLRIERLDAREALRAAASACEGIAEAAGVAIELEPGREAWVEADRDRLVQVFVNLIANGLKHGQAPRPRLRLRGQVRDGTWVATVEDAGPGIAPEDAERIFEPFGRGEGAGARQGAGLGLAICRAILRRLGGDVVVVEPGRAGGRFRVSLPLAPNGGGVSA